MHIPLIIAVLASLAFMLLPALEHVAFSEGSTRGARAYLSRLARWVSE